MLNGTLLHPEILSTLAAAGHGALVLISDANFPASTKRAATTRVVQLNLAPGVIGASTVLRVLTTATVFEEAFVMAPATEGPYALEGEPEIWPEFRQLLAGTPGLELQAVPRQDFYELASSPDVALTIVSGEARTYANLLLRIGVVHSRPLEVEPSG